MARYQTLLDAAADLHRRGYRADMTADAQPSDGRTFHFHRGSWFACVAIQKNGRVRVVFL